MSLEYTILGVLMDQPTHGYSIKKHLLETFSKNLGLNDGQLYPALSRLERRGWIQKQVVEQRRSPTKHLYRVTPEGKVAFFDWLEAADPEAESTPYDFFWRYGFLQKCSFFRYLDPASIVAQSRKRLEEVDRRIEELEGFLQRMEEKKADPYRRMIVEYGIRQQRMRREWLEDLRARTAGRGRQKPARLAAAP